MKHLHFTITLLALCFGTFTSPASADTITGGLYVEGFLMVGQGGFSNGEIDVTVAGPGFVQAGTCFCPAGTTTSFDGQFSRFEDLIVLQSADFVLPLSAPLGLYTTPEMPFTFQASQFGPGGGAFTGSGIVTGQFFVFTMEGSEGLFYNFRNATYQATDAAPVPEPATVLLLGTGLLGAGVRRWRQRKA